MRKKSSKITFWALFMSVVAIMSSSIFVYASEEITIDNGNLMERGEMDESEELLHNVYVEDSEIEDSQDENSEEEISALSDGLKYQINGAMGYVVIQGYNGEAAKIDIPSMIEGFPVKKIAGEAFEENDKLMEVVIPDSVDEIGNKAFAKMPYLSNVVLSANIKTLEVQMFRECPQLKTVVLSDSVTEIGAGAFYKCENLKNINMPKNLKKIGSEAFEYSGIEGISMPDTVESIGRKCFAGCSSLCHVRFSKCMKEISELSFGGTISLKNIEIPEGIKIIKSEAFARSGIEEVILPPGVEEIESEAFRYSCLRMIDIPDSIQCVSRQAFAFCEQLETFIMRGKPESRGGDTFVLSNSEMKFYGLKGNELSEENTRIEFHAIDIPPDFQIKITDSSTASLMWNPVDDDIADYKIYRSTDEGKSYTEIGSTHNTYWIDKNLNEDIAYYYKICPYYENGKDKIFGQFSSVAEWKIIPVEQCTVEALNMYKFTGKEIKPVLKVKMNSRILLENKDYTLTYLNNIDVGTGKIILTGMNQFTGVREIEFKIVKDIIKLNKSSITRYSNCNAQKTYTLKLSGYTKGSKIKWSSSNSKIATVDSQGKVTAKAPGTCIIKASVEGQSVNCKVTVKKITWDQTSKAYVKLLNSKRYYYSNYLQEAAADIDEDGTYELIVMQEWGVRSKIDVWGYRTTGTVLLKSVTGCKGISWVSGKKWIAIETSSSAWRSDIFYYAISGNKLIQKLKLTYNNGKAYANGKRISMNKFNSYCNNLSSIELYEYTH